MHWFRCKLQDKRVFAWIIFIHLERGTEKWENKSLPCGPGETCKPRVRRELVLTRCSIPRVIINVINADRFFAKLLVYQKRYSKKHTPGSNCYDILKCMQILFYSEDKKIFFILKEILSVYKYECLDKYHKSSFVYN